MKTGNELHQHTAAQLQEPESPRFPQLPETGYLRIWHIIGNRKANPPIPALFPVSKTKLYDDIKNQRFPPPIKLGPRTSAWPVESIRQHIAQTTAQQV